MAVTSNGCRWLGPPVQLRHAQVDGNVWELFWGRAVWLEGGRFRNETRDLTSTLGEGVGGKKLEAIQAVAPCPKISRVEHAWTQKVCNPV